MTSSSEGVITLTKHEQDVVLPGQAGAKSPRRHSPPRASGAQMASGGSVVVQVNGRSVLIPEHALRDGLSDLRLATGVCVGLEDYTEGVALILSALDKSGVIQFPSGHLAHK